MGHLNPSIAVEWPKGCTYWKLPKVKGILDKHGLDKSDFDGCAVGIVNADGIPLKKPWSVATNVGMLGKTLSKFKCRCTSPHAQGRGQSLKNTENYAFKLTDAIHAAFSISVSLPSDSINSCDKDVVPRALR